MENLTPEQLAAKVKSVSLNQVQADLAKTIVYQEKAIEALYVGFSTNTNVILHGPAGYGKTQVVKAFCKYFDIPLSTISGYKDMEVEKLLGMPNMKSLMEKSKVETAFENSAFNNYGVLVLEEFLDVRPETAACLKDIITEGGLREGNKFTPSNISVIVICTNGDPYKYSNDDAFEALYLSRFPIICNVKWGNYNVDRYKGLFEATYPEIYKKKISDLDALADICAKVSKSNPISPRLALNAANITNDLGINFIVNIPVFSQMIAAITETVKYNYLINEEFLQLHSINNAIETAKKDYKNEKLSVGLSIASAEFLADKVNHLECYDENMELLNSITDNVNELNNLVKNTVNFTEEYDDEIKEKYRDL